MTPTINVNLMPCSHPMACILSGAHGRPLVDHATDCEATPILIPCPIPRSVTFDVVLGDCARDPFICTRDRHGTTCPARPLRVSCSIGGKTWEESEVTDPEGVGQDGRLVGFVFGSPVHVACRERWALVRALVLAQPPAWIPSSAKVEQRNAVFAALADMARAEEVAAGAMRSFLRHMPDSEIGSFHRPRGVMGTDAPSSMAIAAYVEHLIEQVGVLP